MPDPRSTHIPEFAGGLVAVTGEAIINTTLRNIRTVTAVFAENNFVANEEGKVSIYPLPNVNGSLVVRVEKTGTNDGVVGDSSVDIWWSAVGE